ncbi:hypothetical protein GcM1_250023 [Golovinomyces cichoracearum]|jgi:hypothetical protein|uniref:Uncharacterized protein n=1 Tax=Golovinomyces cichoracearum TaxID=62708 RepID=A0A420IAM5_9PEZI|nr:hypothetical protein GcM1_250023 [Golovinomyces cichoracearum]
MKDGATTPPSSSLAEEKASTAAVILSRGLPDPDEAQLAPLPLLAQGRAVIASSYPLARLLNAFLVAAKQLLSSPVPPGSGLRKGCTSSSTSSSFELSPLLIFALTTLYWLRLT